MNTDHSSLIGLLKDLRSDGITLLQQEVSLVKSEITEDISRATKNAVQIGIGGAVVYAGVLVLLFGVAGLLAAGLLRAGLDAEITAWLAPSIVGLVVILVGWVMISKAKKLLSSANLAPEETLQSLRENKQWAESKLKQSHEQPAL